MKILIVKLSSLGDVVHALPVLQDIRRALPDAQIDWVVERAFASMLRRCQNINRVIECELRLWRKSVFAASTRQAWRAFKSDLQREAYDAVIDLQGLSKSALVSWLARLAPHGRRYGLANRTDGSAFEAPARWAADVALTMPAHIHAVVRSRELCARALGYPVTDAASYGLLSPVDRRRAMTAKAERGVSGVSGVVALMHGTSRADKQWPLTSWVELGRRLNAHGYVVALTHGCDAEQLSAEQIAQGLGSAMVWPRLSLDALIDALIPCAGVIGVDSGPSHIAVALDLPHVQIYNFDTAWRTGPEHLAHQRSVYARPTPGVEAVWQAWLALASEAVRAA